MKKMMNLIGLVGILGVLVIAVFQKDIFLLQWVSAIALADMMFSLRALTKKIG